MPSKSSKRSLNKRKPWLAHTKKDDSIMGTNDSSIVSKRSVCKLYYPDEPDFYEPFTTKFVRRNPLINRGYWLRMHAIEQVVCKFLQHDNGRPKAIVNLGCGYDPLAFQFWHRHASMCDGAIFVDVDYPQLMERKRKHIFANATLRDCLFKTNVRYTQEPVLLKSDSYIGLGCDLRDLKTLEETLKRELDQSASVLFVAEVSVTYMSVSDSDALIRWSSTWKDAQFCLLEQYLPAGTDHPFARTMLGHFDNIGTPIHAVNKYPELEQQRARFLAAGWRSLTIARNLWDLWSDPDFTPTATRCALDAVEPFDEWEEFALFGGHYFLLLASNDESGEHRTSKGGLDGHLAGCGGSHDQTSPPTCLNVQIHHHSITSRRFGTAFALQADCVAFQGGQGTERRLTGVDVFSRSGHTAQALAVGADQLCSTSTVFKGADGRDNVLVCGGRKSPNNASQECSHFDGTQWKTSQDLSRARYRHSTTVVRISSQGKVSESVLLLAGRTSKGEALFDPEIWSDGTWHTVAVEGEQPAARFGTAFAKRCNSQTRGVFLGGMAEDGSILSDLWEWEIVEGASGLVLRLTNRTHDVQSFAFSRIARMGASLLPFADGFLLVGGVRKAGIVSPEDDILFIRVESEVQVARPTISLVGGPWPLLVGFGAAVVSPDEILIAGGGAVCFSMGSFWNEGYVSITTRDGSPGPWNIVVGESVKKTDGHKSTNGHATNTVKKDNKPKNKKTPQIKGAKPRGLTLTTIPRVNVQSAGDFKDVVAAAKPVIIEGLDMGPCTELWTIDYLKDKIGPGRDLVIHECESDQMTFRDKNFKYTKRSAGSFLDGIAEGEKTYLRALSATQPNKVPTKLEDDFPTLASDFHIPAVLAHALENYHSSPLRIAGPVTLWLHYDVLANILCQIKGTKTLRLYPPSDVNYLDLPAGGSSSNTEVLTSKDPKLQHTHPHIASLKPGDILFIPPMWAHTATPKEGYSVAVNVFFRNLETGYAAGKDVYGNRDLQAYENGRRDVERIAKAFKSLPSDVGRFYMERLAMELQEKAEQLERGP